MGQQKFKALKFLIVMLVFLLGLLFPGLGETRAASSYTNAKEFYESTGKKDDVCYLNGSQVITIA